MQWPDEREADMKAPRTIPVRPLTGFTLVEVMVVVIIIGILAGMLVPRLAGRTQEAKVARAQADIRGQISLALDLFEQDVGRYPTTEEGLGVLITDPGIPGWKGPYFKGDLKPDPWDIPYSYTLSTTGIGYVLVSAGPDRQLGTADDISQ
jgi:general secretion pathway protein G